MLLFEVWEEETLVALDTQHYPEIPDVKLQSIQMAWMHAGKDCIFRGKSTFVI